MKNNTIMEYADNGIIVRYKDDTTTEIYEDKQNCDEETFPQFIAEVRTIAKAYGSIIANTLDCFDDDVKRNAIGFKVNIEIVPVFNRNKLIPKQKK